MPTEDFSRLLDALQNEYGGMRISGDHVESTLGPQAIALFQIHWERRNAKERVDMLRALGYGEAEEWATNIQAGGTLILSWPPPASG